MNRDSLLGGFIADCYTGIHLRDKDDSNEDQSNLARSGIALESPPNSSFVFARRQHTTDGLAAVCNCMLDYQIFPPLGVRDPI